MNDERRQQINEQLDQVRRSLNPEAAAANDKLEATRDPQTGRISYEGYSEFVSKGVSLPSNVRVMRVAIESGLLNEDEAREFNPVPAILAIARIRRNSGQ